MIRQALAIAALLGALVGAIVALQPRADASAITGAGLGTFSAWSGPDCQGGPYQFCDSFSGPTLAPVWYSDIASFSDFLGYPSASGCALAANNVVQATQVDGNGVVANGVLAQQLTLNTANGCQLDGASCQCLSDWTPTGERTGNVQRPPANWNGAAASWAGPSPYNGAELTSNLLVGPGGVLEYRAILNSGSGGSIDTFFEMYGAATYCQGWSLYACIQVPALGGEYALNTPNSFELDLSIATFTLWTSVDAGNPPASLNPSSTNTTWWHVIDLQWVPGVSMTLYVDHVEASCAGGPGGKCVISAATGAAIPTVQAFFAPHQAPAGIQNTLNDAGQYGVQYFDYVRFCSDYTKTECL